MLVLAQEEARLLNHSFIGTEHILLGLVHEGEGVAARALVSLGIELDAVRLKVEETIGPGSDQVAAGSPPFTPRSKKVLELSLREALQLGHNYIGTEHILLGMIREGEGVGSQVLKSLGADLSQVRQAVLRLLRESGTVTEPPAQVIGLSPQPRVVVPPVLGVEWPRHPRRVVSGPTEQLTSAGIEFRVVGVLIFDRSLEVLWRISGIPAPLVDLMQDPTARGMNRPAFDWTGPPVVGSGSRLRSAMARERSPGFITLTDDADTHYEETRATFEPQESGEWAGLSLFTPKPGEQAQLLRVQWQGQGLEIPL